MCLKGLKVLFFFYCIIFHIFSALSKTQEIKNNTERVKNDNNSHRILRNRKTLNGQNSENNDQEGKRKLRGNSFSNANEFKNKSFKCNSCDREFSSPLIMKAHVKFVHEGNMDLNCDSCGKTFASIVGLFTHIRSHEGQKDSR